MFDEDAGCGVGNSTDLGAVAAVADTAVSISEKKLATDGACAAGAHVTFSVGAAGTCRVSPMRLSLL